MIHYSQKELVRLMGNAIQARQYFENKAYTAESLSELKESLHWASEASRLQSELFKALRSQHDRF